MLHNILSTARFICALIACVYFVKAALKDEDTHKTVFYGILILMMK